MSNAAPTAAPAPSIASQATALGLGVVTLTGELVANAPTDVLPLALVEARRIFPYRLDEATKQLFVAVADPDQLKQAAPAELQAQRKLGRILKLQLVDRAMFDALLPKIRERFANTKSATTPVSTPPVGPVRTHQADGRDIPQSAQPKTSGSTVPTIDLKTVTIPRSVFLKIPHDVATKFRIIAFAAPSGSLVKLATDRPSDPGVIRVVDVIRAKRGVTVELHQAPGSQIDDLLDAYGSSIDPVSLVAPAITKAVPVGGSQTPVASHQSATPATPATPKSAVVATGQPQVSLAPTPKPVAPPPMAPRPPIPTAGGNAPKGVSSTAPVSPTNAAQSAIASPKPLATSPAVAAIPPLPAPAAVAPKSATVNPKPSESMPVDTSPVVTPIDTKAPGKIQLATPLPSLNPLPNGGKAPLPTEAASAVASGKQSNNQPLPPVVAPVLPPPISPTLSVPATPAAPIAVQSLTANSSLVHPPVGAAPAPAPTLAPLTLESTDDQNLDTAVGSTVKTAAELEVIAKTGLIPKLLAGILQYAVNTGASDIHVEAEAGDLRVRYRIDGQLGDVLKAPMGLHAPLVSRLKILSKMKIDEQRVPQDGRFAAVAGSREVDFRVSTLPAIHGEKVVLRILDKSTSLKAIDQLGIDGTNGARVTAALAKPFGIILVTGPTGSGKTTTLYAMLNTLNKPGVNIVTLEDPVEYELPGITQTQVKPKIGFSFAEGLRSILRQDPDVIMVGEIRDRETASLATHAALTGHLVLSTLHTNNAAGAIPRFLDMGVEPFLIASSMEAVIGQRLVRMLCEHCRQPAQLTAAIQQNIQEQLARSAVVEVKAKATAPLALFAPKGCDQCHGGYKGRLGLYEVMTVSPEIESLTAKKAPLTEIEQLAISQGMITMKQDGILKALQGLTSIDEILRVTTSD